MMIFLAGIFADGNVERLFWGRPVSAEVVVLALIAALLLTWVLYYRGRGLPMGLRILFATLRFLALGLLIALLFEPMATVTNEAEQKRRLPILVDVSESMGVKDQRKRSADLGNAAGALGVLPLTSTAEEIERLALSLGDKQRAAIADSSRLDLARSLLGGGCETDP